MHVKNRCGVGRALGALCLALLGFLASLAQADTLRADHPLVGVWTIDIPGYDCTETYVIRSDGTATITSGQEVAESILTLSDKPDRAGFYTWVDHLVKDNGKKDCTGEVMKAGKRVTNFILMKQDHNQFYMCRRPDLNLCVGPFIRAADENT